MSYYVLPEPEEVSFDRAGVKGKLFPTFGLTAEAQYTVVVAEAGQQITLIEHESDLAYYILEGQGQFIIDETVEECHAGNLVVIPMGTKFTYQGQLKMLEVCTPPWEEEQEETVI